MVAAAEKTETLITEIPLADGLIIGLYTATTVTVDDWVVLSNAEAVRFGIASTTADGTDQEAYHSTNTLKMNVAGAASIMAVFDSVKSTGGST